jgi:hypothetical protein
MANFCHIAPIPHLDIVSGAAAHLALAHLVQTSDEYTDFYKNQKEEFKSTIILDNSAFEMYKQGRPMYDSVQLISMAQRIGADYVVMSDYPNERGSKTINAAKVMAPLLKEKGFGTFFCPQSRIADAEDLFASFNWAAQSPLVDYIGVSILNIPNAYGVEKGNKLQRFVSRFMFMQDLHDSGILDNARVNGKKIHLLGMLDGPNEIRLMSQFAEYINTWDSSAAIWYGLHAGKQFDGSPTGILEGKYEEEVDFNYVSTGRNVLTAKMNKETIDELMQNYLPDSIQDDDWFVTEEDAL